MALYRDHPTRAERAKAIAGVAVVHLALGALALSGSIATRQAEEPSATKMFDVALPPPPPPTPPPPPPEKRSAEREAGAEGKMAKPTPIVAPPPRIVLPAPTPLPAAPIAGTGSATSAGAGTIGSGPGAGGSGSGAGAGGTGFGGIGEDAHLLSGGLNRRDYRRLRAFSAPSGRAVLAILIGPDGRVAQCSTRQSSGDRALDAALCAMLGPRMRWSPARDREGRPLTVGIYYTAVWSRD